MSGPHSAFFYGTLMAPEVFYTVCYPPDMDKGVLKELHEFQPAILHGYCRHRVQSADYPGIIKEEGKSVLGVYASGLTLANIDKLDFFEGPEYVRTKVKVKLVTFSTVDGKQTQIEGEEKETNVYVFLYPDQLERREWDFEHFRKEKMKKWTRADFVFDGCDDYAKVEDQDEDGHTVENVGEIDEAKKAAV